jgi:hypothetical protein
MCNSIDDLGFNVDEQKKAATAADSFDWGQAATTLRDVLLDKLHMTGTARQNLIAVDQSEPSNFVRYLAMYKIVQSLVGNEAVKNYPTMTEAAVMQHPDADTKVMDDLSSMSLNELLDEAEDVDWDLSGCGADVLEGILAEDLGDCLSDNADPVEHVTEDDEAGPLDR